jgi:hypothetical protein
MVLGVTAMLGQLLHCCPSFGHVNTHHRSSHDTRLIIAGLQVQCFLSFDQLNILMREARNLGKAVRAACLLVQPSEPCLLLQSSDSTTLSQPSHILHAGSVTLIPAGPILSVV